MTAQSPLLLAKARIPQPCLMLVTDRQLCHDMSLAEAARQAVAAGITMVQLREKDLPAAEQLELGAQVQRAIHGKALFIINDRVDVAHALGADGTQLPESGLPVRVARDILGPQALIGRSVHSLEGAITAEQAGADYLIYGPVYATRSHPSVRPVGRVALQEVAQAVSIPVLAIGGITAENIRETLHAGAAGAAIVSAIFSAAEPKVAAAELVAKLSS